MTVSPDPTLAQATSAAGASAGVAASAWSIANDVAQALFGIPIGVVLAAAAGAFFARTFTAPATFLATLRGWAAWTLAGAYSLPLALHLSGWPPSIAASIAFVLSCALQLLAPVLVPMIIRNSPVWVRALVDRFTGAVPKGGGNGNSGGSY